MDKLSSIIPGNARIHTVDVDESRPARPGTPSFGRQVGTTASAREKITISAAARENLMKEIGAIMNPQSEAGAVAQQKQQAQQQQMPSSSDYAINESLAELSGTALNKYA